MRSGPSCPPPSTALLFQDDKTAGMLLDCFRPKHTRAIVCPVSARGAGAFRLSQPSITVAPSACDVRFVPSPDARVAKRTRQSRRRARCGAAGDVWPRGGFPGQTSVLTLQLGRVASFLRSEERRVGKECRSRWSTYHVKKNK